MVQRLEATEEQEKHFSKPVESLLKLYSGGNADIEKALRGVAVDSPTRKALFKTLTEIAPERAIEVEFVYFRSKGIEFDSKIQKAAHKLAEEKGYAAATTYLQKNMDQKTERAKTDNSPPWVKNPVVEMKATEFEVNMVGPQKQRTQFFTTAVSALGLDAKSLSILPENTQAEIKSLLYGPQGAHAAVFREPPKPERAYILLVKAYDLAVKNAPLHTQVAQR